MYTPRTHKKQPRASYKRQFLDAHNDEPRTNRQELNAEDSSWMYTTRPQNEQPRQSCWMYARRTQSWTAKTKLLKTVLGCAPQEHKLKKAKESWWRPFLMSTTRSHVGTAKCKLLMTVVTCRQQDTKSNSRGQAMENSSRIYNKHPV